VRAVVLVEIGCAVLALGMLFLAVNAYVVRLDLRAEHQVSETRLLRIDQLKGQVKTLTDELAAARGDYAAYLVELYNFNGLPMLSFYAAESELSAHIFAKDENVTTARVRVLRLHGPAPGAPPADGVTADGPVPTFRDRLSQG
jgi:hypothetical protein